MASINIKVFRGKEGFHKIKSDWNRIVNTLKHKHLIHLYDWYKSYIDTLEDKNFNAIFLVMFSNSEPIAIFPIQEQVKNIFGLKFRILHIPHCKDIDIVDFIFDKQNKTEKLMELLIDNLEKYLGHKWHCIFFPNVLENSSINFSLQKSPIHRVIVDKVGESQYLHCGSYDQIKINLSTNFRQQLNLKRNQLSRLGNMEYISVKNPVDLKKAFAEFLNIEASGWKSRYGTAIKNNADNKKYYEQLTYNFSTREGCEINFLRLNNKNIASSFWLLTNDTIFFLKIGYDKQYAKMSPGVLLLDDVINKYSNDKSFKFINLMSDYTWQARWKPHSLDVFNILIFNKSLTDLLYYSLIKFTVRGYRKIIKPMMWKYESYVKRIKKNKRVFLKNA